ncbi:MAG: peptidylprolyl isomerase [Deltaproteobacteria bacterium]|nr:peptidylprolyl isomerase [Deltaproteobacteria bacterium]
MPSAIKQLLVAAAVVAIALVFVLEFRPGRSSPGSRSGGAHCAIEVGGDCIDYSDYVTAYRLVAPRGGEDDRQRRSSLRQFVLQGLLERWLLNQDAKRLGLSISDEEVNRELAKGRARLSLPAHLEDRLGYYLALRPGGVRELDVVDPKTQEFDYKRYERNIRAITGKTPGDFRDFQRHELVAARMRALIRSRARVAEAEARSQFVRENERIVVDYVRLLGSFYAEHVIDQSPKSVEQWAGLHRDEVDPAWESHKKEFLPECRVARHILIEIDAAGPDKDSAKKEARSKIEEIKRKVEGGEDFAALAREHSKDAASASKGGELGCFGRGQTAKPFEDAAFALEPGQISNVVETTFGFHLIKLERVAKDAEAEAIGRAQVSRELYLKQESERLCAEGAKQILAAAAAGKPLAEAVKAHLDEALGKRGELDGKKKKTAKKKDGEEEGDEARKRAEEDPNRPKVEQSAAFSVLEPPFPGVREPGVSNPALFALTKAGQLPADVVDLYGGYAVAQLSERKPAKDEDWKAQRERYRDRLRSEKQNDVLVLYINRLRSTLAKEVKYDRALLEPAKDEKDKGQNQEPSEDE